MGSFNRESSADDVMSGIDLSGRTALVTGASAGLGASTAHMLARHGARVILAVRDTAKAAKVVDEICSDVPDADLLVREVDLASLASIRGFTDNLPGEIQSIDLLIANAGLMGTPFWRTEEGFEMQFGVNHLGHFLLVNRLMPLVERGKRPRIVLLSSFGHRWSDVDLDDPNFLDTDYHKFYAYGRSKTANVLFAVELERRWGEKGIHAYAVHPGGIQTELGRHFSIEDREEVMAITARARKGPAPAYKDISQGIATTLYAATGRDLEGRGGIYLEDSQVAEITGPEATYGVREYAMDPQRARDLWTLSEELVQESFPEPV